MHEIIDKKVQNVFSNENRVRLLKVLSYNKLRELVVGKLNVTRYNVYSISCMLILFAFLIFLFSPFFSFEA